MPIQDYGVLKARPLQGVNAIASSPHYQILVTDENETQFRLAVNVQSQDGCMNELWAIRRHSFAPKTNHRCR